jgi:hypothetical protein
MTGLLIMKGSNNVQSRWDQPHPHTFLPPCTSNFCYLCANCCEHSPCCFSFETYKCTPNLIYISSPNFLVIVVLMHDCLVLTVDSDVSATASVNEKKRRKFKVSIECILNLNMWIFVAVEVFCGSTTITKFCRSLGYTYMSPDAINIRCIRSNSKSQKH